MKSCPQCGSTYSSRIDFCFEDGQVLVNGQVFEVPSDFDVADVPSPRAYEEAARAEAADDPDDVSLLPLGRESDALAADEAPTEELVEPTASTHAGEGAELDPDLDADVDLPGSGTPLNAPPPPATPVPVEPMASPTPQPLGNRASAKPLGGRRPAPGPTLLPAEDPPPALREEYIGYESPKKEEARRKGGWVVPISLAGVAVLALGGGFVLLVVGGVIGGTALTTAASDNRPEATVKPHVAPKPPPGMQPLEVDDTDGIVDVDSDLPDDETDGSGPDDSPPDPVNTTAPRDPPPKTKAKTKAKAKAPDEGPGDGTADADTNTEEPAGLASLRIASVPAGANVFVDKAAKGPEPMILELERGKTYNIRLELDGYEPWVRDVKLGSDQEIKATLKELPKTGPVLVILKGAQPDHKLYVDNKLIEGNFPHRVALNEGEHTFKVVDGAGESFSVDKKVEFAADAMFRVELSVQ